MPDVTTTFDRIHGLNWCASELASCAGAEKPYELFQHAPRRRWSTALVSNAIFDAITTTIQPAQGED